MPTKKITKKEIINKALEVFRQKGYHKTSMNDLAKACGLFKGSFYYYFKSKDELMQEVLKSVHAFYQSKIFPLAYDTDKTPKERLIDIFNIQKPIFVSNYGGCLFGNLTLQTISLKDDFKGILQIFFEDWHKALAFIFESANHSPKQAQILAQQSIMELEGAIILMRLYNDKKLLYAASQRVLDRV